MGRPGTDCPIAMVTRARGAVVTSWTRSQGRRAGRSADLQLPLVARSVARPGARRCRRAPCRSLIPVKPVAGQRRTLLHRRRRHL